MKVSMKTAALVMAAVISASAMPINTGITAYAAVSAASSAETEGLKAAISDVKKLIEIPSALKEFDYETKTSYGMTFYKLKWYREKTVQRDNGTTYKTVPESITVEYHGGMLTDYYYYNEKDSGYTTPSFAKLSSDEQQQYAEKYLKQLVPNLKGNAVIERSTSNYSLTYKNVTYNINRIENGISVKRNHGQITIDRDTGKLISFKLNWWNDAQLPDSSKKLSVSEVSEIFKQRKGLKAYYSMFSKRNYDSKTGTYTNEKFILPVYAPKNDGENEIDALTGEFTSIYNDMKKYSYTDAYTWDTGDGGGYMEEGEEDVCDEDFSEAELSAIDKESSYISAKKALEIIKSDGIIKFNDGLIQKSRSLTQYENTKGETKAALLFSYTYTTSDKTKDSVYLNVLMDAETGEIIQFSKTYAYGKESPTKNTTTVKHADAVKKADAAAKHFLGDKASEYKLTECSTIYKDSTSQILTYTRYVNGLPTDFDHINITVDSLGEVLNFDYTYHDMKFPEAKLVSEDTAYEKLFAHMKPDLYYTGFLDLKFKSHTYLTYEFDDNYIINALTGERINYSGDPYYTDEKQEEAVEIKYTDISGYKYEKEINTLLDYGIFITKDSVLAPDEDITIGQFIDLCEDAYDIYLNRLYPSTSKWDAEKGVYVTVPNPKLNEKLTREELAKIYVEFYTNSSDAAKIKGIYKQPYSDVSESSTYCGYIAIAKGMGFISQTADKYHPTEGISKGECLKTAYDFLCGSSKEKKLYNIIG